MDRPEIRAYLKKGVSAFHEVKGDKKASCYVAFSPSGFTRLVLIPKAGHWNEKLGRANAAGVKLGVRKKARMVSKEEKMKLAGRTGQEGR